MLLLRVKLITQGEKRETSTKTCNETMLRDKLRVFVSRISPPFRWLNTVNCFRACSCSRNGLKSLAILFKFVVCNPCLSSPSLTILVPLWFIIISLMFFYLSKVLFSGFLQFNGNFVDAQNNSKYCDWARPFKVINVTCMCRLRNEFTSVVVQYDYVQCVCWVSNTTMSCIVSN